MAARPHTHLSNRARARAGLDRRPAFKSVLENPFQISWPSVPINVQNAALARLVHTLENVPPRSRSSRRSPVQADAHVTESSHVPVQQCLHRVAGASPHLVGINAVTRELECQLGAARKHVFAGNPLQDQLPPRSVSSPIAIVFVCSADVDPPALVEHIPYLVAGCNSLRNVSLPIKLVTLPMGSEPTIAQMLGVRRAAILAFRHSSPLSEAIRDILESVPTISAPWLCPLDTQGALQLVPTHIKQLHTTAPKDMKVAREQRSKARAAAKKNASSSSRSVRRKPRVMLTTGGPAV